LLTRERRKRNRLQGDDEQKQKEKRAEHSKRATALAGLILGGPFLNQLQFEKTGQLLGLGVWGVLGHDFGEFSNSHAQTAQN
jgi:hypothetical protein